MFNRIAPLKNNKLGIKGVHWDRNAKKFRAQIHVNKKQIHLGCFNVLGDADSAYRKAEEKYFGEFAGRDGLQNCMLKPHTDNYFTTLPAKIVNIFCERKTKWHKENLQKKKQ